MLWKKYPIMHSKEPSKLRKKRCCIDIFVDLFIFEWSRWIDYKIIDVVFLSIINVMLFWRTKKQHFYHIHAFPESLIPARSHFRTFNDYIQMAPKYCDNVADMVILTV